MVASLAVWRAHAEAQARFNPLHCGAVVASGSGVFAMRGTAKSFNPLHCGAVVASFTHNRPAAGRGGKFQSPSLRGSGRFRMANAIRAAGATGFNPLHCGAVVASKE